LFYVLPARDIKIPGVSGFARNAGFRPHLSERARETPAFLCHLNFYVAYPLTNNFILKLSPRWFTAVFLTTDH
jgi:hypothetical protein